ncbi:peroxiredoxin [Pleomorphomonas sp. NRK KF1]|uniref:peroxiredoxin n=1 Tax=Pleomorphomonas sp. NRK KF1 TaxID=2943000 RepID=UPI0021110284|nr:peroxiredoxin [Pleomorphomonas sp. NRK KF1]
MSCTDSAPKTVAAPAVAAAAPVAAPAAPVAAAPVVSLPRINEPAPAFSAMTTFGPRSLADYKGKWLVLFSHPADFTPVCTTEFMAFAKAADEFKSINTELLGLSIDSIFSHIAWVRNIEEKFGVAIPFPIIEDLKMDVAMAYGMIHPGAGDTSAVRATFIIDPEGILRAMVYYPMTNGRSVAEIMRLVKGLQTSLKNGVATPEGWQPGDKVLVGAPVTVDDVKARLAAGLETTDWYFSKKTLA